MISQSRSHPRSALWIWSGLRRCPMSGFKFINYVPRADFAAYANQALENIREWVPVSSRVSAFTIQNDHGFHFFVRVRSKIGSFAAVSVATPNVGCRLDRLWQKHAIDLIVDQIRNQIQNRQVQASPEARCSRPRVCRKSRFGSKTARSRALPSWGS